MKTFPFDTFGLEERDEKVLYKTYAELKKKYDVIPDGYFDVDLKDYDLFSEYSHIFVRETIEIPLENTTCYLLFAQVSYSGIGGKGQEYSASEYRFFVIGELKKEFAHLLLRKMTFIDKLHEVMKPVRVKFENDKEFSNKYYVLAKDSLKAELALGSKYRDALMNLSIGNFFLEMKNNHVIIGNKTPADTGVALECIDFMQKISEIN
ncbi:MAG: hypothetical protein V4642_10395 [Bacteroidota bacterium]